MSIIITIVLRKFIKDGCCAICQKKYSYTNLDHSNSNSHIHNNNQVLDNHIQIIIDANDKFNKYNSEKIDLL
jgi:hypothetical protein